MHVLISQVIWPLWFECESALGHLSMPGWQLAYGPKPPTRQVHIQTLVWYCSAVVPTGELQERLLLRKAMSMPSLQVTFFALDKLAVCVRPSVVLSRTSYCAPLCVSAKHMQSYSVWAWSREGTANTIKRNCSHTCRQCCNTCSLRLAMRHHQKPVLVLAWTPCCTPPSRPRPKSPRLHPNSSQAVQGTNS